MRPQHDAQHTHYVHQLIIVWPMCRPSPIFVPKNCVPRLQWQALAQRSGRTMSIIEAIFRQLVVNMAMFVVLLITVAPLYIVA